MTFNLIYVGGQYIGTLNGNTFISDQLTSEQVSILVNNPTEDQIIQIFNPKLKEKMQKNEETQELVNTLLDSGLFEEKNGAYYREGNPISVPKTLLEKYKVALETFYETGNDDYFNSLDNFWLKCSLNPNVEARENLFWFLDKWGFTITPNGYVVGYRNVNIKNKGNIELHNFVATQYVKIKSWKKSPKNYDVFVVDNEYKIDSPNSVVEDGSFIGNLQELYDNLSDLSETVYTDQYSGKFKIKIGELVFMDRKDCDETQSSCSSGLHLGGANWLKRGYFGTEGLVCLFDPQDVVSVPVVDEYGKLRVCAYLPIGVAEWDGDKLVPVETGVFEVEYERYSLDQLNAKLQAIDPNNQVIHKLTFETLNNQIYRSIDEYRHLLNYKNVDLYEDKCCDYDDFEDEDYDENDYDYFNEEE